MFDDTIAAIATPPGAGAIAIIRVSGKDTFAVVDAISVTKKKLRDCASHTIHYGTITAVDGEVIDDVLFSIFRGPRSYTGEDVIEISTHGNQLITAKVMERLIQNDVRVAEPGEFTRRAYINGRIDLSQAEAVIDVISARSDASLRGARNQLDGLLSQKISALRERLIHASSLLELELDFAEEDIEFVDRSVLQQTVCEVIEEIAKLLATYSFGRVIRDGVHVALVGKPNVGKSSLLNYLLKESRAIVSEIPGTTRDVIREEMTINGILFRIYDTAGIRDTEDIIEMEGVKRSMDTIRSADIVLLIEDALGPDDDSYNELLNHISAKKIIRVLNKIDKPHEEHAGYEVYTSAKTGEGINILLEAMKRHAGDTGTYTEKTAIVTNARHYHSLSRANEFLHHALSSGSSHLSPEFISVDLRNAEAALSEIIGVVSTDDILNNIFAKFCIGK
ncbi:MAG: tRNA uridine-5-carboxymethylaminomethyl(34) synthesis GTPase MnmE [Ignavibacteria bacterium]|nr:tRNA uridine-5-carboxymethylaminomethyl(34) synthesis GTPase MnmE [Ignavibacteria bacterium]